MQLDRSNTLASGQQPVRIAVIGSGLAGLVTAYLLQTLSFTREDGSALLIEVHLYERSASLGMDSSSISVKTADGSHCRVWRLYQHLGIGLRESNFSYSFSRISAFFAVPARVPSPPPPYSATPDTTESPPRTPRLHPQQTPLFLYEGSNGLRFPPLALPSTLTSSFSRVTAVAHLILLSLSYLHLLFLAFFYFVSGLSGRSSRIERIPFVGLLGIRNVGNEPLGQWCSRHHIWKAMREEVLEPLVAAVSTIGREEVGDLPMGEIIDYIVSTFGASHHVAATGVQEVVAYLSAPLPAAQLHLSSALTSITRSPTSDSLSRLHFAASSDGSPSSADFTHVVFATQANQAKALLETYRDSLLTATDQKREQDRLDALGAFEYVRTLVVNHYDESVLPANEADRRDLNLASFDSYPTTSSSSISASTTTQKCSSPQRTLPPSSIQATHIISRTHPSLVNSLPAGLELLQTTNPIVEIDPSLVLSETWYERACVSVGSKRVLPRFLLPDPLGAQGSPSRRRERGAGSRDGELQGRQGIWFVGSWCAEGLPLLEGCVSSAERAVAALVAVQGGSSGAMPF